MGAALCCGNSRYRATRSSIQICISILWRLTSAVHENPKPASPSTDGLQRSSVSAPSDGVQNAACLRWLSPALRIGRTRMGSLHVRQVIAALVGDRQDEGASLVTRGLFGEGCLRCGDRKSTRLNSSH